MMLTPSNVISLLRGPAALLFLSESLFWRTAAILIAMATDWLDGYLARRYNKVTRLGTVLDPLMDKFFVCFALTVFLLEGQLQFWQILAFLARDIALMVFGCYLALKRRWAQFEFRAIGSGKLFTALQLVVLLALTWQIPIPSQAFLLFIFLAFFAFFELQFSQKLGERKPF